MPVIEEVHLGDVGTVFEARLKDKGVAVDVSDVTVKQLKFKKPSGQAFTKDAAFTTNGEDGYIEYAAEAGFLDELGWWELQGYVEFDNAHKWHSKIERFKVLPNIE